MKIKNKVNLKYGICLIFYAILLYATLNIVYFNDAVINNISNSGPILLLLPGIYAILALYTFKKISQKDFESENEAENSNDEELELIKERNKKESKKMYKFFWIIFVLYILISCIVGINAVHLQKETLNTAFKLFKNVASISLPEESILQQKAQYDYENVKVENYLELLKVSALSCLPFIFIFFMFYRSFIRKKQSNRKVFKIISTIIISALSIGGLLLSFYYFIDIPQFKYLYTTKNEGVLFEGYSDIRDYYKDDCMIVPEKIAGKPVIDIGMSPFMYCDEISLSSKFPKKSINGMYCGFSKIKMYGEPEDWYELDGIIYNKDGTEIIYINTEDLYVSENVTKIEDSIILGPIFLNTINVSENNEVYFSYDNVLYQRKEEISENGDKVFGMQGFIITKNKKEIVIPTDIYGDIISLYGLKDKTIIIPKDLEKLVRFVNISNVIEYKVEDGNMVYDTYEGALYEKGLEKMIAINASETISKILLPKEVKEFDEECLYNIVARSNRDREYEVEIEENNINLLVKDDLIYTEDGTKLLMPAKYTRNIKINENVKEISKAILYYYDGKIEISENNPYLMIDENDDVTNKFEDDNSEE